jgi:polar amino acid transport system substrate-binding protein
MHEETQGGFTMMKKMKKTRRVFAALACGALAVACVAALAGCGGSGSSSSSNSSSGSSSSTSTGSTSGTSSTTSGDYKLTTSGKLTVGVSADYPPMESLNGDKVEGFDADLMTEIASRLGLSVEFKNQAFDTLVTAVAGGTGIDCAASSITIDDERAKEVDFTTSYYDSNLAIVVLKNSGITARDALSSAKVGAQSGTSGEAWVQENLKNASYTPYQETPDLLQALRSGQIQAAVYDDPVAQMHVSGEYNDCQVLETIATGEQYGIIVNKSNTALTEAMNKAMKEMESDGTMNTIRKKYGI